MPRWKDERREMTFLSLIISSSPCGYLLGMPLLGILIGISLWLNPVKNNNIQAPQPKQLKTAAENIKWGYQIMETEMPGIMQNNPQRRQAHCKQALPYFKRAISLNPKLGLAYQGQGMSLICQNSKMSGRNSLRKARTLYINQGNYRDVEDIDLILKIHK
jgi:hypothetical protein